MEENIFKLDPVSFDKILKLQEKVDTYEKALSEMLIILTAKKFFPIALYDDRFFMLNQVLEQLRILFGFDIAEWKKNS